jgi:hypothetical protein
MMRRGAPAALLALAAALLLMAPAGAGAAPQRLWQSCDGGEDDIGCLTLRGVATAPATAPAPGDVYVADQTNKAIDEFTAWGEFVKTWGWDVIASGPDDNGSGFEVCVPANGDVCKAGVQGAGTGQLGFPQGVAVDSVGNVYVADAGSGGNNRVQKFSAAGEFLRMWGKGVNSGTSGNPDLCTNAGSPTDICGVGGEGTGNGQFSGWGVGSFIAVFTNGTAIEADDKVYVGDVGRIQRFDTGGAFQAQITEGIGATEKIKALAVDKAGNLYAAIEGKPNVRKWNPAGVYQGEKVTVAEPVALAADIADSSNNLYVISGNSNALIRKFNSSGVEQESWGQEEPPTPKLGSPTGIAAGRACGPSDVYVSSGSFEAPFLRAYGPTPTKLEPCPKPGPPRIHDQYAISAAANEAHVAAQITPRFWDDATYFVQYASAACIEAEGWEAACVKRQPTTASLALGKGGGDPIATTTVLLTGLVPDTEYRFRFAAQSGGGGPVFGKGGTLGKDGAEGSFHTFAPSLPLPPCPNDLLRSGPGAQLADCRAYEMVSPVDKGGGDILSFVTSVGRSTALYQSALSGEKLAYSSYRSFGDAETQPYTTQYIAERSGGGWSSHAISPPRGTAVGGILTQEENEFRAFSSDLCSGWLVSVNPAFPPLLTPDTVEGTYNLYRRSNCGGEGYTALGAGDANTGTPLELQGVSGDGVHTVFRARDRLAQDAAISGGQLRCQSTSGVGTASYQWLRNGTPIAGKTASEYIVNAAEDEGKTIQCQVRILNGASGATQVANPAWVIAPYPAAEPPEAPEEIPAPSADAPLAVGGPGGQMLGCDSNAAQWSGSPSFAYQWYRNGTVIAAANEQTYQVQTADLASPAVFQCEAIATNAGGTVAKASENLLTSPVPSGPASPRAGVRSGFTFGTTVYESFGAGQVRSVCLAPGTRTLTAGCSAGSASGASSDGRSMSVKGAISEDGGRIFWSNSSGSVGRIFVTVGGAETVALSASSAQFWAARGDGTAVLLGEGEDLYRLDVDKAIAEEAGAKELIAHKVMGVLGESEDLTRVYLVSKGALTGSEENSEGDEAVAGQPNLFLAEGGGFAFVGTLSGADARATTGEVNEPSPINVEPFKHSARVTPDGGTAAFMSSAQLTGYENTDIESGKADAEVYHYEADSGRLECVSCNPSGVRPAGRNISGDAFPFWAAAQIPGGETQFYSPRALSDDGSRLFFNSFESLVLTDTNGGEDAYEWEAAGAGNCSESSPAFSPSAGGCVSLLSSGKSPQDSEFIDASPSGHDVFVRTGSSLVASDPGQIDIYDARVDGGFSEAAPAPPCEGEACQAPAVPPNHPTPSSLTFDGSTAPVHQHKRRHRHKKKHRKHRKRAHGEQGRARR